MITKYAWLRIYLLALVAQSPGFYSFGIWALNIQAGWVNELVTAVTWLGIAVTFVCNIALIHALRNLLDIVHHE